ncbi:MAG TPA: methyltransferase domain-containing protein [Nitrospiraceae bacterium]|nr:methyltransferase domain-containing protein [Nitrospiraceae bacterium]
MSPDSLSDWLAAHLAQWGLRRFESDAAYDQWQRTALKPDELTTLLRLSEQRRAPGAGVADEIVFYDYAATRRILPVLYSQRYDYYATVGAAVAERIAPARSALDVGCGIGVLTTFYARQFPQCSFVGVDRSPASIAAAQENAAALGLTNVRFECLDADRTSPPGSFDLIITTQALLQTEQDPGLPSRSWQTFERGNDLAAQIDFERRTGLAGRIDRLCATLAPDGRVVVCEKTRHLARRVPFQRAFAARGLMLLEPPLPIRYAIVEEGTDDGPLYVLSRTGTLAWDESPEQAGVSVDVAALARRPAKPDEPLYENHQASAQQVWTSLPDRRILQETTKQEPDGRQVHLELGVSQSLTYLYCANTFDQRQLVIVENQRAEMLTQYYQELLQGLDTPAR